MAIRYKITNRNRTSIFASGKYLRTYSKGRMIKAKRGTLGILTFHRRKDAEVFIRDLALKDFLVLRVKPFERGRKVNTLCSYQSWWALDRYYKGKSIFGLRSLSSATKVEELPAPIGTLAYPRVKVID